MTKKILLLTAATFWLSLFSIAYAQEEGEGEDDYLKPDYGMFSVEYRLSPFDITPLSIENLRVRYFIDYNLALRAGLKLNYQNESPTDSISLNGFGIGVKAGLEFHFPGTRRLSPYWGFELNFESQGYNDEETIGGTVFETRGVSNLSNSAGERGFLGFGGMVLLGADLYLAKNFYMGAELGLGAQARFLKNIETLENGVIQSTNEGGNEFRLGINADNLIRIGYVF